MSFFFILHQRFLKMATSPTRQEGVYWRQILDDLKEIMALKEQLDGNTAKVNRVHAKLEPMLENKNEGFLYSAGVKMCNLYDQTLKIMEKQSRFVGP